MLLTSYVALGPQCHLCRVAGGEKMGEVTLKVLPAQLLPQPGGGGEASKQRESASPLRPGSLHPQTQCQQPYARGLKKYIHCMRSSSCQHTQTYWVEPEMPAAVAELLKPRWAVEGAEWVSVGKVAPDYLARCWPVNRGNPHPSCHRAQQPTERAPWDFR